MNGGGAESVSEDTKKQDCATPGSRGGLRGRSGLFHFRPVLCGVWMLGMCVCDTLAGEALLPQHQLAAWCSHGVLGIGAVIAE